MANVSHELRTPISVIKANAETLLDGALDDPEHRLKFVDAVLRHADRLGRLSRTCWIFRGSRLGDTHSTCRTRGLQSWLGRSSSRLRSPRRRRVTDVVSSIPPEVTVKADRKALEHILINLVTNAVKYSGENGHVEVATTSQGAAVRIEVRDDGPGIDPKTPRQDLRTFLPCRSGPLERHGRDRARPVDRQTPRRSDGRRRWCRSSKPAWFGVLGVLAGVLHSRHGIETSEISLSIGGLTRRDRQSKEICGTVPADGATSRSGANTRRGALLVASGASAYGGSRRGNDPKIWAGVGSAQRQLGRGDDRARSRRQSCRAWPSMNIVSRFCRVISLRAPTSAS